jgi:hypothetical protein
VRTAWTYHEPSFEHEPVPGAAWAGHRRFGYDLVRNLRPRCVVELGVCLGTSFLAFCQAVKDGGLDTTLWAVDTWKGDPHAGFYDATFLEQFRKGLEPYRSLDVRELITSFDDARRRFEPSSIDLLHIDGCHTYEAVRHDYETWSDAVGPDGVLLFHDIAHQEGDFGVYRLWEELRREHATVSFVHSHGLGVLLRSPRWSGVGALEAEWRQRYGASCTPSA